MARAGCLLGYGANQSGMRRLLAHYIALVLRGATPGELPIEQPLTFEFAVNLGTARALGVTIPPSLLQRADEVIEYARLPAGARDRSWHYSDSYSIAIASVRSVCC